MSTFLVTVHGRRYADTYRGDETVVTEASFTVQVEAANRHSAISKVLGELEHFQPKDLQDLGLYRAEAFAVLQS